MNIMNITQKNVDKLLRDASYFVANMGTSVLTINVSMSKEHIKELLNEDFNPDYEYLSENKVEIYCDLVKMIITIK